MQIVSINHIQRWETIQKMVLRWLEVIPKFGREKIHLKWSLLQLLYISPSKQAFLYYRLESINVSSYYAAELHLPNIYFLLIRFILFLHRQIS